MPEKVARTHCMSVDRYLMHKKTTTDVLCVDEFVAMHVGKVDAVVAMTKAKEVRLYGDAKQIPYDPFCAEFEMKYATLRDSVDLAKVTFMAQTHRFGPKMCAIWLDQYPAIYPCKCCATADRDDMSVEMVRSRNFSDVALDKDVRYHTFDQASKEEVKSKLSMVGTMSDLRGRVVGGLATTHEDQGSTHLSVVTFRPFAEYDKNASTRNPSLYNRVNYVLSDMTRARNSYTYHTMCEEDDEVCKRVRLGDDAHRLGLVSQERGMGLVTIRDMLD